MYHVVTTKKSFEQASADLEVQVSEHEFSVLHIHDLGKTMREKGMDFSNDCRVFEICNAKQAAKVMAADMRLNMALPCRISVYTEGGETKIGMIKPGQMLSSLSEDPSLVAVAKEVEAATIEIIDGSR